MERSKGRGSAPTTRMGPTARTVVALPPTLNVEQRIRIAEVIALTGWGRTRIYGLIKRGDFPEPERDGKRCSRWRVGDILDCLAQRKGTRLPPL